jgi:hypothetical protein
MTFFISCFISPSNVAETLSSLACFASGKAAGGFAWVAPGGAAMAF